MVYSLILTMIVLVCLSLVHSTVHYAPMLSNKAKWLLEAAASLVAVAFILRSWHIISFRIFF